MKHGPRVADALSKATRAIHATQGVGDALQVIVRTARDALPGIDHVGISLARPDGTIQTLAATDEVVRELDALQHSLHEGPCVYAMTRDTVVRVEHAEQDDRWPTFMPEAVRR